jgi:UDP-N-acetylmuramoylalanine--D-glutamate ligase
MIDFHNKTVAVLGAGVEGKSVVEFLRTENARVTVFEKDPFPDLSSFDYIVRSPGIRPDKVRQTTTTATNIFFERCPCPIIGVTGTKGKGTTSTLIYEMLRRDRKRERQKDHETVFLGGNIGISPLSFLHKLTKDCVVVLELSSFQLMDCRYSPDIAVVLMVVPEHQDWHTSVEEYVEAKFQIFKHQTSLDTAVLCIDYPINRSLLGKIPGKVLSVSTIPHNHPGVYVSTRETFVYQTQTKKESILPAKKLLLPGRHNWENAAAAIAAAKAAHVTTASIRHVLQTFSGLPHRLEKVGEAEGVTYYNDSFSTTPETTIAAIHAFEQPKVLILGGSGKNSDFTQLGEVISSSTSIRGIVGIGQEWKRMKKSLTLPGSYQLIEGCKNMEEIVKAAKHLAKPGDVVLLSPACASFDMFENYKDRGDQFRAQVEKISTLRVENM